MAEDHGKIHVVSTCEEFEKVLDDAGDKTIVIDIWAPWCGPCVRFGPKFVEMSNEEQYSNGKFA